MTHSNSIEIKQIPVGALVGLFLGFFCFYLFASPPKLPIGEELKGLSAAKSIFLGSKLAEPPPIFGKPGIGLSVMEFPILNSFLNIEQSNSVSEYVWNALIIFSLPAALASLLNIVLFLSCIRIGYSTVASVITASLCGFGTMVWPYSQTLFPELLLALLLLVAFYSFIVYRKEESKAVLGIGGVACGYAVLLDVSAILYSAFFSIYLCWELYQKKGASTGEEAERWVGEIIKSTLFFGFGFLLPLIAVSGLIQFLFGKVAWFSGNSGLYLFSLSPIVGLYGLLLSSGKSVFLYNPALLSMFFGSGRFFRIGADLKWLCLSVILGTIFFHSASMAWAGDWAWGPRFLLPAIPFAMFFVAGVIEGFFERWKERNLREWIARMAFLGIVALSIISQVPGVAINRNDFLSHALQKTGIFEETFARPIIWPIRDDIVHVHFIPEFSPMAGHIWMLKTALENDKAKAQKMAVSPPWNNLNPKWVSSDLKVSFFKYNIWWLYAEQIEAEGSKLYFYMALGYLFISFCGFLYFIYSICGFTLGIIWSSFKVLFVLLFPRQKIFELSSSREELA